MNGVKKDTKLIFDNIFMRCREEGLSIARLEKEAGLSRGTIIGWAGSSPRAEDLQAAAGVLDCSVEDLHKEPKTTLVKCKKCGWTEHREEANFCMMCGSKLNEVCNCWVKKCRYSCGENTCPGRSVSLS